jgi:hypothetical protein
MKKLPQSGRPATMPTSTWRVSGEAPVRDPIAAPGPHCSWPPSESQRFLDERLAGFANERYQPPQPYPPKHYVEAYFHALVELVRSDIPLDPNTRYILADILESHFFPKLRRRQERKEAQRHDAFQFVQTVTNLKAWLRNKDKKNPLSALGAEEAVAALFDMEVEALRKRYHRARQLLHMR